MHYKMIIFDNPFLLIELKQKIQKKKHKNNSLSLLLSAGILNGYRFVPPNKMESKKKF